jgi:subfamily B ATP-binding cassette protein MsbA
LRFGQLWATGILVGASTSSARIGERPSAGPGRGRGPLGEVLRPYEWALPLVAALGFLASLLESIGIGLIVPLAAVLFGQAEVRLPGPIEAVFSLTAAMDAEARVVALGGLLVLFTLVKGVVQGANELFIDNLAGRIARDIQNALCRRVVSLDYPFFLRTEMPRLVQIITNNSWDAAQSIRERAQILTASITLLVFTLALMWLDWRLASIIVAGALAIQLPLAAVGRMQRARTERLTRENISLGERMLAVLGGIRAIRVFGQQEVEQEKFGDAAERTRRAGFAIRKLSLSVVHVIETLVAVVFVAVLVVGYRLDDVSLPALLAFLVLLARAQPFARTISRSRGNIAALSGSLREVEWLLSQKPAPISLRGSNPVHRIDRPIRFKQVTFGYGEAGGAAAVTDLTVAIRPGVATALVGQSGAGKTTLVNLLCRLVEPSAGTLFHGNDALSDLDPEQWRARIAIAGQDIALLDGTVAQNIAYAKPDATRDEIELAAQVAGASEFIARLPEGYGTRLGLNSVSLSGGQRQRIGLARALVRRPDLLILDEAISAVDSISETEIIKLLHDHRHFRTALVISHRKSTLAACQDCIVLEQGRLAEAGPIERSAYYRAMA